MKETDEEERRLRRYLLGELEGVEQDHVEERFLTDRDFKERVLIAEDELVEDYLADELSEAERVLFITHFLSTPEQQRKLRIAGSLKRYLGVATLPPTPAPGKEVPLPSARKNRTRDRPSWKTPWLFVPVSLALLLAVVIGTVWVVGARQKRIRLAEIRREFERINDKPVRPALSSVYLTPLSERGGRTSDTLLPSVDGADIQLWLLLITDEYPSYQVVFQRDGDTEQFPINDRRPEITPRGKAIPVTIPSRVVRPGVFVLKLNGITGATHSEVIGEYTFQIRP